MDSLACYVRPEEHLLWIIIKLVELLALCGAAVAAGVVIECVRSRRRTVRDLEKIIEQGRKEKK